MSAAAIVASATACGSFSSEEGSSVDGSTPDTSIVESGAREAATESDTAPPEAGVDTGAARHLRVFVLTTPWSILNTHLGDGGTMAGRNAADLFCADEASAAGLGSSFRAWMSSNEGDAIDRLPNDADWSLPVAGAAAQLVFPSRSSMDQGQPPLQPLSRGASGIPLTDAESRVWTGTSAMGRATGVDCTNWTVFGTGTAGRTGTVSSSWTSAGPASCDAKLHVFCFGY